MPCPSSLLRFCRIVAFVMQAYVIIIRFSKLYLEGVDSVVTSVNMSEPG